MRSRASAPLPAGRGSFADAAPHAPIQSAMSEEASIQVNFSTPKPLFPLDSAVLLPQQILPLHIFEDRYTQMVSEALDSAGQFAMAVFQGNRWKQEYHGCPPIRPVVCVAQIIQHEQLDDGRFNVIIQGICRARVVRHNRPDNERLYRTAMLEPIGVPLEGDTELFGVRERFRELLSDGPLVQLRAGEWILQRLNNDEIPTAAVLELVSFTLMSDPEVKYQLLAEPDAATRAEIVEGELLDMQQLIRRAQAQRPGDWPKGCSWN